MPPRNDMSTCNKATMAVLAFVVPVTYIAMISGGAAATYTDRDNPSVEQTWTFGMVFLFTFVVAAIVSLARTIYESCTDNATTDVHLTMTMYWLSWVFVSAFQEGIVWWYRNKDYTNDVYQDRIATLLWGSSLAITPIAFLFPILLWGQMST